MSLIFVLHLFVTFFMTGLCWFVQIVHYPLFRVMDPLDFPKYERKNYITGFVTVPTMIIEMITGFMLLYSISGFTFQINAIFIVITALSTFIYQVPMHLKLMDTYSSNLITRLIRTNWIRTASWSVRSVILALYLMKETTFI